MMDDGTYKAVASYATELERLRQVNAVFLKAAKEEISNCPFCQRHMECRLSHDALRKAINLAEGK